MAEALRDQRQPVRVELLGLDQDLFPNADLAEVVQQPRVLDLPQRRSIEGQIGEDTVVAIGGFRQPDGELGHPLRVPARGGVALLDRVDAGPDEALEQRLDVGDEVGVLQGDRGLARQRAAQPLVLLGERAHAGLEVGVGAQGSGVVVPGVDQLHHREHLPVGGDDGRGEHRAGLVAEAAIEGLVVVEAAGVSLGLAAGVEIGDPDRATGADRGADDGGVGDGQGEGGEVDVHRVVVGDGEAKPRAVLLDHEHRSRVGTGDRSPMLEDQRQHPLRVSLR